MTIHIHLSLSDGSSVEYKNHNATNLANVHSELQAIFNDLKNDEWLDVSPGYIRSSSVVKISWTQKEDSTLTGEALSRVNSGR